MSQGILWAVLQEPLAIERRHPNGEPHHITLQYGVERSDWEWAIGQEFDAVIWAEVWSDRNQALRVRLPAPLPCCNTYPHITVSWVDGAEPVESNAMLTELVTGVVKHQFLPWNPRRHVPCRIEFHEWASGVQHDSAATSALRTHHQLSL